MEFIDTHCHIQSAGTNSGERTTGEIWAKQPDLTGRQLIAQAAVAGVKRLICVGCDLPDSRLAIDFAQVHDQVWASIGIHPHEAKTVINDDKVWHDFATLATQPKVVAIGECGLDYFYNHSSAQDQQTVLHLQLELAKKHDLPIIFHVREAFDDFWPIFEQYPGLRGVLHSYTDNAVNLERALGHGLYIGVNGIATFAKQAAQIEVYRSIPLANLVLETDAPFLTPTPYRGSINQPKQIVTVAKFLANLTGVRLSDLATATTANASTLFRLK